MSAEARPLCAVPAALTATASRRVHQFLVFFFFVLHFMSFQHGDVDSGGMERVKKPHYFPLKSLFFFPVVPYRSIKF